MHSVKYEALRFYFHHFSYLHKFVHYYNISIPTLLFSNIPELKNAHKCLIYEKLKKKLY